MGQKYEDAEPLFFQARLMSAEEAGGHGGRWELFSESAEKFIVQWLPTAVENAKLVSIDPGDKGAESRLRAAGELQVEGLLYSDRWQDQDRAGVMTMIAVNVPDGSGDVRNELWSSYPFFAEGASITGTVGGINLHPNRAEAAVNLFIADGPDLFIFDTLFFKHRGVYRKGREARFSISALAYSMEPSTPREFIIDDPDEIRRFRATNAWAKKHGSWSREHDGEEAACAEWEPETPEDLEPIRISTERMAAYLPSSNGGGDDFTYQGEVVGIQPRVYVRFGMPVWRVDVTVSRMHDSVDLTLPFYVTEKSFAGAWRPKVGEYVSGTAWLQGFLMAGI